MHRKCYRACALGALRGRSCSRVTRPASCFTTVCLASTEALQVYRVAKLTLKERSADSNIASKRSYHLPRFLPVRSRLALLNGFFGVWHLRPPLRIDKTTLRAIVDTNTFGGFCSNHLIGRFQHQGNCVSSLYAGIPRSLSQPFSATVLIRYDCIRPIEI